MRKHARAKYAPKTKTDKNLSKAKVDSKQVEAEVKVKSPAKRKETKKELSSSKNCIESSKAIVDEEDTKHHVGLNALKRAEDASAISANMMRACSNRTSNQLSLLVKKRKERMINVASFGSLSRFSHPNDSDSSFRNAYNEYNPKTVLKIKRKESPTSADEKNQDRLIGSRNATYDASNTSKLTMKHDSKLNTRLSMLKGQHTQADVRKEWNVASYFGVRNDTDLGGLDLHSNSKFDKI